MENDNVVFWLISGLSLFGLIVMWTRTRFALPGWMGLYAAILLIAVLGRSLEQPAIIYAAAAIWLLLVLLPILLIKLSYRYTLVQRFAAAHRIAQIVRWLHPADGSRELAEIIHAYVHAQQGNLTAVTETLNRYQNVKSQVGLAAIINLYRVMHQWEELLVWFALHRQDIERYPQNQFLQVLLRARGETGDVRGMVELYDQNKQQFAKLVPTTLRDSCRLMLFAFCGKRQAVEILFDGSLKVLLGPTRAFWLATADMAAGATASAKRQFEELLPGADPLLRAAIERRLSRISIPKIPLDASANQIVEEASREQGHEVKFGARRSLFSSRARATQIIVALNVAMFIVEICQGGGTDPEVLFRLGALFSPAVYDGEWWRLVASLFLHFGILHLAMNMSALGVIGPFLESALGVWRFILVYLLAGIGSMGVVMLLTGPDRAQLTAGASGCIMGLVGATGALMLRGWLYENALAAKRRLFAVVAIVLIQTAFDFVVPHVSMTGHLSGAFIGLITAMTLRERPRPSATQQEKHTVAGSPE